MGILLWRHLDFIRFFTRRIAFASNNLEIIDVTNDLVKSDDLQIDAGTGNPTGKKSDEIQVTPQQDAHLLLENHCSQCHLTQTLEQDKKSRADWETILEKMEQLGVQLDDAEKAILLDYLAASDK